MTDYQTIFDKVESTLIRVGGQNVPEETVRKNLDKRKKVAIKRFTDTDYFDILVEIPFYAGFRAATVNNRIGAIHRHFPDYKTVAGYDRKKVGEILNDPHMIRHEGKIQATVNNARTFKAIVDQYGSFQEYVDSFAPKASFQNLMQLRQDLRQRFRYLGFVQE